MKFDVKALGKSVRKATSKNAPVILAVSGVFACGLAVYHAYKAGTKVEKLVEEKKDELQLNENEKLPVKEYVKATWKIFTPVVIEFGLGGGMIFFSNKSYKKRNATLLAAYKLSEKTFTEYKDKVIETIGERKEREIVNKVAEEKVKNTPTASREVIITGKGNALILDTLSDKYFESDIETIRKAINDLNYRMMYEHYITLNDYYYALGVRHKDDTGDERGWDLEHGQIDVIWGSEITQDGRPCLTITHNPLPRPLRREWQ